MEESDQTIGRLINTRSESEGFVLEEALRPRMARRRACEGPTAMTEANQIAILSMLGTDRSDTWHSHRGASQSREVFPIWCNAHMR